MGKEMVTEADVVDVSAAGTLVWVRRPNGSWWPGRVVSPLEVPDSCPPPPRTPAATPILLLGRRDGTVFVDWYNLQRCKRVKPFRCGERELEDCIRRAEEQHAARRRDQRVCRYARKEDAVLQALDIERARLLLRSSTSAAPTSTRKRRTPNDSEDDAPQRMKDLTDIGRAAPRKTTPPVGAAADLNQHLPATSQMKRSKHSHHQQHPCGASRKRDRSRPLSELCNGDAWNGFKPPNGQRANQHFMRAASSLDTVVVKSSSHRLSVAPVKKEPVDDAFPCLDAHLAARSIFKADHQYVHQPCTSAKAPTWEGTKRASNCSKDGIPSQYDSRNSKKKTTSSVAHEGGNRIKIEPECEHHKERVAKHKAASNGVVLLEKRVEKTTAAGKTAAPDAYKVLAAIPNSLDGVGAVLQKHPESKCKLEEPSEHRKERVAKHKAASNGVVLLKKRVEKTTAAGKTAAPDAYKVLAAGPNSLGGVSAVLQKHPESKCKLEEPSETISNRSTREDVPVRSVVFELPHQVLAPQHRDPAPAVATCLAAVKPVKTLQLNSSLYEVEVSAQGASSNSSSKGGRVPLVSLMSRSSRRPVVGYPVSMEELEDTAPCPPAASIDDDHPSTSNNNAGNRPLKEEAAAAAPRHATPPSSLHRATRATQAKTKSRRKASEDESWRPHTKNNHPAAALSASPRKMRRLSSFAPGQSGGDRRPAVRVSAVGELCGVRGPALACVPLRLVFSRIHEALTYSGK